MPGRRAVIIAEDPTGADADGVTPAFAEDMAGRTLVERQLAALEEAGIRHITIVVPGTVPDAIRQHFATRAHVTPDDPAAMPGGLHALWRARDALADGALVVHGSTVFTSRLVRHVAGHPSPDALVYAALLPGRDAVRVRLAGPYVIDVGRHVRGADAGGESVGLMKLGPEGARRLLSLLEPLVSSEDPAAPAWLAFARLARTWPVVGLDTAGLSWARLSRPEEIVGTEPFARQAGSPARQA